MVGDMPVETLVDGAPRYQVARERPGPAGATQPPAVRRAGRSGRRAAGAARLADIGSRRWVYAPVRPAGRLGHGRAAGRRRRRRAADAVASARSPSRSTATAGATSLDPRRGGDEAVCEAARNVACTGARPAAMTNCLNFGNPETGEVGYELAEAIEGMALACEALGLPVVSGNVSLYNEHFGRPIHPTPVVGVVGRAGRRRAGRAGRVPRASGDVVLLAGDGAAALDGSAYQKLVLGEHGGRIPEPDLDSERRLHEFLAAGGASAGCCAAPTTSPTAASRVALAEAAHRRRRSVRRCDAPTTCSARATAASVISRRRRRRGRAGASWPATCRCVEIGTVGGARIALVGRPRSCRWPRRPRCYEGAHPERDGGAPDVRHLRHLRPVAPPTATSPGSPTSASTRCSTAARRARASPSPTAAG